MAPTTAMGAKANHVATRRRGHYPATGRHRPWEPPPSVKRLSPPTTPQQPSRSLWQFAHGLWQLATRRVPPPSSTVSSVTPSTQPAVSAPAELHLSHPHIFREILEHSHHSVLLAVRLLSKETGQWANEILYSHVVVEYLSLSFMDRFRHGIVVAHILSPQGDRLPALPTWMMPHWRSCGCSDRRAIRKLLRFTKVIDYIHSSKATYYRPLIVDISNQDTDERHWQHGEHHPLRRFASSPKGSRQTEGRGEYKPCLSAVYFCPLYRNPDFYSASYSFDLRGHVGSSTPCDAQQHIVTVRYDRYDGFMLPYAVIDFVDLAICNTGSKTRPKFLVHFKHQLRDVGDRERQDWQRLQLRNPPSLGILSGLVELVKKFPGSEYTFVGLDALPKCSIPAVPTDSRSDIEILAGTSLPSIMWPDIFDTATVDSYMAAAATDIRKWTPIGEDWVKAELGRLLASEAGLRRVNVTFFTEEKYRKQVGEARYELETVPPLALAPTASLRD